MIRIFRKQCCLVIPKVRKGGVEEIGNTAIASNCKLSDLKEDKIFRSLLINFYQMKMNLGTFSNRCPQFNTSNVCKAKASQKKAS